ncbi:hypothetical protein HZB94_04985 [Candidatus Falkowbacteria bacterium]|nr:hypothetical protein [Candidatus Falkowbacteria bacterium]
MINNNAKILVFSGLVSRECEAAAVPKGRLPEAKVLAERRLRELVGRTQAARQAGNFERYYTLRQQVREISPSIGRHL